MNTTVLLSRRALSTVCLSCRRSLRRQFSSSPAPVAYAATTFQSYSLPSRPAGAQTQGTHNVAVPDTPIAQPAQQPLPWVHETRPPPKPAGSGTTASVPASEVQTSKAELAATATAPASSPAPATATATASPTSPAPPKRARPAKLRTPRKAAMKLTPSAVSHLRGLLEGPEPKLIKVGVRNRGCSGLAYQLDYVDQAGPFDETVEQDGVRVLVDSKALFSIIGSEMDWVEDKLSQRFVFRNPNISECPSPRRWDMLGSAEQV